MKKKVIINYSSSFGLPGMNPDAGLALIHLFTDENISIEGIIISSLEGNLRQVEASLDWLLDFSGRGDIPVFGAAESLLESAAMKSRPVLLDIGAPAVLTDAAELSTGFFDGFSEIVFYSPPSKPPQRRGLTYSPGTLSDAGLRKLILSSGARLTMFGADTGLQTPLGIDELIDIRAASKPLYYLLKDYLIASGVLGRRHSNTIYLFRLTAAVYLTNPSLFAFEQQKLDTGSGRMASCCTHINDIARYFDVQSESWGKWNTPGGPS